MVGLLLGVSREQEGIEKILYGGLCGRSHGTAGSHAKCQRASSSTAFFSADGDSKTTPHPSS